MEKQKEAILNKKNETEETARENQGALSKRGKKSRVHQKAG
jgi:hypothetical protein